MPTAGPIIICCVMLSVSKTTGYDYSFLLVLLSHGDRLRFSVFHSSVGDSTPDQLLRGRAVLVLSFVVPLHVSWGYSQGHAVIRAISKSAELITGVVFLPMGQITINSYVQTLP